MIASSSFGLLALEIILIYACMIYQFVVLSGKGLKYLTQAIKGSLLSYKENTFEIEMEKSTFKN